MPTISTIGTTGRNYSTVAAWHAAFANGGWEGQCYNDSEFVLSATITLGGTSVANYEKLSAAAGQSAFDNSANPLKYDVTKGVGFKCSVGYVDPFYSTTGFLTLQGIQLRMANGNSVGPIRLNGAANVTIDRCLVQDEQSNSSSRGAIAVEVSTSVLVTNSVLISFNNHGIGCYYSDSQIKAVNCTVVAPSDTSNAAQAFRNRGGTNGIVIKNCTGFGFGGGFTNMASSTGSNNATDQSSFGFTSTSSLTSQTYASQFNGVVSTAMDFKLKSGAALIDAGVTDTTDIPAANDIFATSRPQGTAWDIGAHELGSSTTSLSRDFLLSLETGAGVAGNATPKLEFATAAFGAASSPVDVGSVKRADMIAPTEFGSTQRAQITAPTDFRASLQETVTVPATVGGSVQADVLGLVAILATLAADMRAQQDAIGTLRQDQTAPVEFGQAARIDRTSPVENGAGVAMQITAPLEFSGTGNSVTVDIGAAIEWGASQARDVIAPTDRTAAVAATAALVAAVGASLSCDALTPAATIQQVQRDISAAVESLAAIARDQIAPAAFSFTLNSDCIVQIEFTGTQIIVLVFDPAGAVIGRDRFTTIVGRDRKTTIIGN